MCPYISPTVERSCDNCAFGDLALQPQCAGCLQWKVNAEGVLVVVEHKHWVEIEEPEDI